MTTVRASRYLACALLGALAALAAPARGDLVAPSQWDHVMLETWDGWRYFDVTVAYAEADGYLLITRSDGSQRVLAYEEVRRLVAADGSEITDTVLPADALLFAPDSPPEFAQPRPLHGAPPELTAGQPRFRLAASGGVGWGLSLGDWYTGLEDGLAWSGQVRVAVAPAVYLTALARGQDLDVTGYMPNYPGGYQVFDGTGHVRQFGLGAGVMLPRGWYRQIVPYFEMLLAGASHGLTYDERGDIGDYVETLNDDQLAGILQFGALVPFGRSLAFEGQANWMFTGTSEWGTGSVLGLQVGLCVMLADAPLR